MNHLGGYMEEGDPHTFLPDIWDGEFNNIDTEVDLKLMDNFFLPKYVRDNNSNIYWQKIQMISNSNRSILW